MTIKRTIIAIIIVKIRLSSLERKARNDATL